MKSLNKTLELYLSQPAPAAVRQHLWRHGRQVDDRLVVVDPLAVLDVCAAWAGAIAPGAVPVGGG